MIFFKHKEWYEKYRLVGRKYYVRLILLGARFDMVYYKKRYYAF